MNYLDEIGNSIEGELQTDISSLVCYATDASVYKELPLGVVFPKHEDDIIKIVLCAEKYGLNLIPRAAGTSLAGQVVGNGLIVDIGRHMTRILEINPEERWALIEPGVVRDELNMRLTPLGLFFAPETATSNRCRIGGMLGNNSCGANSLLYGSTRQHILSVYTVLSDGSKAEFSNLTLPEFEAKCEKQTFEGEIYRKVLALLSPEEVQNGIREEYPDKAIQRRSMGYAIDELVEMQPFLRKGHPFNFSALLAGSEGTLAIATAIKVHLSPLPPPYKVLLSVQTNTIEEALQGNIIALKHYPASIELMDKLILDLSKQNPAQNRNRFFIQGDPAAVLIIEINESSKNEVNAKIEEINKSLKKAGIGDYSQVITGEDMSKVWALRKAGLGIMSNAKGDYKPVTVVEDVAILPEKYPDYYREFKQLLDDYDLKCAFYAHISTGELHNKPLFNLKDKKEILKFREFAYENALLVKKYGGCLSGEHGDGRLRGEFLPLMIGDKNYELCRKIKHIFDPNAILNRGKIVNSSPMNENLRYFPFISDKEKVKRDHYSLPAIFDFSDTDGILRAIEKCNGSADCTKSHLFSGTMCPSYQATLEEKYSTRGRANILREFITNSNKPNPFDHKEILDVLDFCLACKACKSECPSNVDMAKLKSEFLYHYYRQHSIPLRNRLIAYYPLLNRIGILFSPLYNFFCNNRFFSNTLKKVLGFSHKRSLPVVAPQTLYTWAGKHVQNVENPIKTVYFFMDEFTNANDVAIGIKAIKLLEALRYQVKIFRHGFSGRTFISKGMLKKAKLLANQNIEAISSIINDETPLIGIEPSAILTFRDEYPDLVDDSWKSLAHELGKQCLLIDEFIAAEFELGHISSAQFTQQNQEIVFHSHCYQKALSDPGYSVRMMSIPENYSVTEIKSGCCGMAGAFGYEKEHFDISIKIGELTLFPSLREASPSTVITATGTSCRHQIKDGTGRVSMHPIEILYEALLK